jgi:hypothetical protein
MAANPFVWALHGHYAEMECHTVYTSMRISLQAVFDTRARPNTNENTHTLSLSLSLTHTHTHTHTHKTGDFGGVMGRLQKPLHEECADALIVPELQEACEEEGGFTRENDNGAAVQRHDKESSGPECPISFVRTVPGTGTMHQVLSEASSGQDACGHGQDDHVPLD